MASTSESLMRLYHPDGTLPTDGKAIWVFGSNLRGAHGAGAARIAVTHFWAQYGVASGITGRSYAIPTKDRDFRTLPIEVIQEHIETFIRVMHERPDRTWWVTRVGCGLAGLKDALIAPLFREANVATCNFPDVWRPYLDAP
jgi:hypothetical protein